jgi:hypothetical protein
MTILPDVDLCGLVLGVVLAFGTIVGGAAHGKALRTPTCLFGAVSALLNGGLLFAFWSNGDSQRARISAIAFAVTVVGIGTAWLREVKTDD